MSTNRRRNQFKSVIDRFDGGTQTIISDARLGKKPGNTRFAVESVNLMQYEDGIWGPRPGTGYFGTTPESTSEIWFGAEYTKEKGVQELIAIFDGDPYRSTNNGKTWTLLTGASWTHKEGFDYVQFQSQLWIVNGEDPLAYYDGTEFHTFNALDTPTNAPTFTRGAGLSTGPYKYYVRYTANSTVGWSHPSPELVIDVDKPRELWNKDNDEYVDIEIDEVATMVSADLWLGDVPGGEEHLDRITLENLTYRDSGLPTNKFMQIPDDDTSGAPKFGSLEISGNKIWGTREKDKPYRVLASGAGQYLGYFSPFYGGVSVNLERGGKFFPTKVIHYRTGKGDPIATVLCSSADGNGLVFQVEITDLTIGDTVIAIPLAYKLVGSRGADAPSSVVKFGDNIGFLNKKGVFFLRSKEQVFQLLVTDDMTTPIRNRFDSINGLQISKAIAYYSPPRLLFSIPLGNDNDIIFVWDDEKRNWTWAWTIGFKQFFEFTDSGGTTHLLGIRAGTNRLIEISENFLSDLGEPIFAQYVSPLIPVDIKDPRTQARIKESVFEIGEVRGAVTVATLGRTKTSDAVAIGSSTVQSTFSNSGVGDDLASDVLASDTGDLPKTFSSSSIKRSIRVRKKVYYHKYRVSSNGVGNSWRLLSIFSQGKYIFKRSPSQWKR